MNREILCRGKRTDNGEWIEGFYFCMVHDDGSHVHHFLMPLGADLSLGTPIENIQVEVDPKTVCQCTEKNDKNGKKIWENDIVKQFADCNELGNALYFFYKIRWNKEYCAFEGIEIYSKETFLFPDLEDVEVIGNIFDNSELLEAVE